MAGPLPTLWLIGTVLAAGPSVPDLYQQSYDLEARGDFVRALATVDQLPSTEKAKYTFVIRRAWLAYSAARYDEAISGYERAEKLAPQALEPPLGASLALMAARRWLDAHATLTALVKRAPTNYLALSRLAFTAYNLGRWPEAEGHYRRVLTLFPADVEMKAGLGWSLLEQGKKPEAAEIFRSILTVAPRHSSAAEGLRRCGASGS